jgi:hypothetical protein
MDTADPPLQPIERADQFPVAGDEVWIRAQFRSISHAGCFVKVRGQREPILVAGEEVFAQLRVGHVLKTYGQ